jgi:cell division protein FtsZ
MQNAGSAFMGIGIASGENRAEEAAYEAINSPLLDVAISGAKGVLFAIAGGDDVTMHEVHQIAKVVTDSVDPDAKIIFGPIHDDKLKKGEIKVTVIATGFQAGAKKGSASGNNSQSPFVQRLAPTVSKPSAPIFTDDEIDEAPMQAAPVQNRVIEEIGDDDEDWSAVPAFLRRKK